MKVGVVQNNPKLLEVRRNLTEVLELMSSKKADLWVLPEFFASGYRYRSKKEVEKVAEIIPSGLM